MKSLIMLLLVSYFIFFTSIQIFFATKARKIESWIVDLVDKKFQTVGDIKSELIKNYGLPKWFSYFVQIEPILQKLIDKHIISVFKVPSQSLFYDNRVFVQSEERAQKIAKILEAWSRLEY